MLRKEIYSFYSCIKYYLLLTGLFFTTILVTILLTNQIELHSRLNQFHSPLADIFFTSINYLGDGIVAVLVIIISWFYNKDFARRLLVAFIITTIIIWIMKYFLFPGLNRPLWVFEKEGLPLYLVNDVSVNRLRTFPSGHSTTAFMVSTALALGSKKTIIQLLFAVAAICIAYSRVYLSQHFLEDIFAGGMIGTLTTLVIFIPSIHLFSLRFPVNKQT